MSQIIGTSEFWVKGHKPPLNPSSTGLIIVDMIYADAHREYGAGLVAAKAGRLNEHYFGQLESKVKPNCKRLLQFFRKQRMPVVHIRLCSDDSQGRDWPQLYRKHIVGRGILTSKRGAKEFEFLPGLEPGPDEYVIEKRSVSAFNSSYLERLLVRIGVTDLVMSGVTTNYGVGHTAIDAADNSFMVTMAEDAMCTYSQETHVEWLSLNQENYFRVLSTAEICGELA